MSQLAPQPWPTRRVAVNSGNVEETCAEQKASICRLHSLGVFQHSVNSMTMWRWRWFRLLTHLVSSSIPRRFMGAEMAIVAVSSHIELHHILLRKVQRA